MHDLLLILFYHGDPAVYTSIMLIFGQILRAYACLSKGSLYGEPSFARGKVEILLKLSLKSYMSPESTFPVKPVILVFPIVSYQSTKLEKFHLCLSNVTFFFSYFFKYLVL